MVDRNGHRPGLDPQVVAEWERWVGFDTAADRSPRPQRLRGVAGIDQHPSGLQVWTGDPDGFEMRLATRRLERITAFVSLYPPCTVRRTPSMLAGGNDGRVVVWVSSAPERGWVAERTDGFHAPPGQLLHLHPSVPCEVVAEGVTARTGLLIPAGMLGTEFADPRRFGGPVAGTSVLARMTARFLVQFATDAVAGNATMDAASEFTAVDLIRAALEERDRPGNRAADNAAAVRVAVADLIDRHYTDPAFDAARIAELLHFSRRQLYRYFADQDTGVAGFIAARRLDRARELLAEDPSRTIEDVAAASGFTSAVTLRNRFRSAYGLSPSVFAAQQRDRPGTTEPTRRRPSRPVADPFEEPETGGPISGSW